MSMSQFSAFFITVPFIFLPIISSVYRLRLGLWLFLLLIPVYMYHKPMFLSVSIGGIDLTWPTLTKDVTGLILLAALLLNRRLMLLVWRTRWSFLLPFFGLAGLFTLSALLGASGAFETLLALRTYFFYPLLGFLIGGYLCSDQHTWPNFLKVLVFVDIVFALIALIHYFVDKRFLIHPSMRNIWRGHPVDWTTAPNRLNSIFTSANVLAVFMTLGLLALFWFYLHRKPHAKLLALYLGSALALTLILTASRSALLGGASALLIIVIFLIPRKGLIYLLVAIVLGLFLFQLGAYSGRFTSLGDNPRLRIWEAHLVAVTQSPKRLLLGVGAGSVGRAGSETSSSSVVIEGISKRIGVADDTVYFIDNSFVSLIFEGGLAGALYIMWLLSFYLAGLRLVRRRSSYKQRSRLIIPLFVMTLILAVSMFSELLLAYPWSLFYWIGAGGLARAQLERRAERKLRVPATNAVPSL